MRTSISKVKADVQGGLSAITAVYDSLRSNVVDMTTSFGELQSSVSRTATITTGLYDSIREVHGSTNSIQQGLNELFRQSDVPLLVSMIRSTIEECIREEFRRNGYGSSSSVDRGIAQEISENNRHLRVPANPHRYFLSWGSSSLRDDQPWVVKRRIIASPRHKYSAWFGIVSTHMKRTITYEDEADGQQLNQRG